MVSRGIETVGKAGTSVREGRVDTSTVPTNSAAPEVSARAILGNPETTRRTMLTMVARMTDFAFVIFKPFRRYYLATRS